MKFTFDELKRYYQSAYWNRVRGAILYGRGGKCEQCASTLNLQVHHASYEHVFSDMSHLENLKLLCEKCHHIVTKKAREERKKNWFNR